MHIDAKNIVSKKKINNLHQIESLVALIDLADEIKISEIRSKKHKVIFRGKYSKGIPKFNTINHLLALLEKKIQLKIKIKHIGLFYEKCLHHICYKDCGRLVK